MSKVKLIYGEPVSPSNAILILLYDKEVKLKFKDLKHKSNYIKLIVKNKLNNFAIHGYSGTKVAMQHMVDIYYLQELVDSIDDTIALKEEMKELMS